MKERIFKERFAVLFFILLFSPSLFAENPVISVLDFQESEISSSDMKVIVSLLSSSLFDTGRFTVIDISRRDSILKELRFSLSGCSDESCQLEAGKMLSAEMIVVGDLARVGSRYILNARMLETETGATVSTARGIYVDLDRLVDDIPGLAEKISITAETAPREETPGADRQETGSVAETVDRGAVDEAPIIAASKDPAASPEAEYESSGEEEGLAADAASGTSPDKEREPDIIASDRSFFSRVGGFPPRGDVLAWSTLGGGAAAVGIGTWLFISSFQYKIETLDPSYELYNDQSFTDYGETTAEEYYNSMWTAYKDNLTRFRTKLIVASGVTVVGAASLFLSRYFFIRYNKFLDERVSVYLLPGNSPEGPLMLSWNIRY